MITPIKRIKPIKPIKPITPAEFKRLKLAQVPDFVYNAINGLLADAKEVGGKFVVPQELLKEELAKWYSDTKDIENVIDQALVLYKRVGWKIDKSVFDWDDPEPQVILFELISI